MDGGSAQRTPRYAEILNVLRSEIASGTFPIGASLPSEAELCARFAVSRFTIREALRRLQMDGIVRRVQGAGSKVVRDAPASVFVQKYRSVSELTTYAEETHFELLSVTEIELSDEVANQVGGAPGEVWSFFRALRRPEAGSADVIAVIESYMPARFSAIAERVEKIEGPIYAALSTASGEAIESAEQEVQALPAPYHIAEALGVQTGAPVLRIMRRYAAASGTLIASFNWHHGGDRYIHRAKLDLGL